MARQRRDLRHEVLGFVTRYVQQNGYAPTCAEIGKAVGLSGKSHASYYLGILEREGHIQRTPRSPRGLSLSQDCDALITQQSFDAWAPGSIHDTSRRLDLSELEPLFLQPPHRKGGDHDG